MRVLLFTVTAGEGHNHTAKAIADLLEERGAETKIIDAYRLQNPLMYYIISWGYLLACAPFFRLIYGALYRFFERRRGNSYKRSPVRLTGRPLAKKFYRVIADYAPDVVVCTHSFAARILDIAKERHGFSAKTVGIVTDFTMHPYWEEALRLDRLVLPCEPLTDAALQKGFKKEQLRHFGIPIHPKFSSPIPKSEARTALGVQSTLPLLLVMGGSMGYGNLFKTLKRLDKLPEPFQMAVVCGNNKLVRKKIAKRKWQKPLYHYGFVQNVQVLMAAADFIVSKPGGLTTSEALSKHLPMIIFSHIPGHEARNVTFLSQYGAAKAVSRKHPLEKIVSEILSTPRLTEMQQNIDNLRKPCAVIDLCDEIFRLSEQK